MADEQETKTEEKPKKKRKPKFKRVSEFKTKIEFFDYMIHEWEARKAHYLKHGDGSAEKKQKKAKKLVDQVQELAKDPEAARILREAGLLNNPKGKGGK